MIEEEEKEEIKDIIMRPKQGRRDFINLFLDQLGKVSTKDEALKLTEIFLERYKGILGLFY